MIFSKLLSCSPLRKWRDWFTGLFPAIVGGRRPRWRTFQLTGIVLLTDLLPATALFGTLPGDWRSALKLRGSSAWADASTLLGAGEAAHLLDAASEFRIMNETTAGKWRFEGHYEFIWSGGDLNERSRRRGATGESTAGYATQIVNDRARLFDFTHIIHAGSRSVAYHRLDRMNVTFSAPWGLVRIGRQAVTWGGGAMFNPADLFNPFSPTDVERDFKVGDDLALFDANAGKANIQALYVVRRERESGDVRFSESSIAAKVHGAIGSIEAHLIGGWHYNRPVGAISVSGYWGNATWNTDVVHISLDIPGSASSYWSIVANLQYSWVWGERNWYGIVEYYFNGIGDANPIETAGDPAVRELAARGNLFSLGRNYLGSTIQYEAHPLLNLFANVIWNLDDRSGLIQPRAIWSISQNLEATFGASLPFGGSNTEFGGFEIPAIGLTTEPATFLFAWISWYF